MCRKTQVRDFFSLNNILKKKKKKVFKIFNWSIIALQHCVGLCHPPAWISRRYTYVTALLNLTPALHPLGWHKAQDWAACIIQVRDCKRKTRSYCAFGSRHPSHVLLEDCSAGQEPPSGQSLSLWANSMKLEVASAVSRPVPSFYS